MNKIKLLAIMDNWEKVREFYDEQNRENGLDPESDACQEMCMAIEEFYTNVASYAYPNGGIVEISYEYNEGTIEVEIIDEGKFFNPLEKPDPDIDVGIDEFKVGGLGIYMCKMYLDDLKYERREDKNIIFLVKKV